MARDLSKNPLSSYGLDPSATSRFYSSRRLKCVELRFGLLRKYVRYGPGGTGLEAFLSVHEAVSSSVRDREEILDPMRVSPEPEP